MRKEERMRRKTKRTWMTPPRTVRAVGLAAFAMTATAVAFMACGPSAPSKSGADLKPRAILSPPGVSLVSACTPTGPEICFNAIDDNCNGVLEEGCGLGTGLLQFIVAWGDSPADVDLSVTDPAGGSVHESNRTSASGLHLDRDCPGTGSQSCYSQNVENVFFEGLEPPRGAYVVKIKLTDLRSAPTPVKVRLGARIGSRSYGVDLELTPSDDQKSFTFTL